MISELNKWKHKNVSMSTQTLIIRVSESKMGPLESHIYDMGIFPGDVLRVPILV